VSLDSKVRGLGLAHLQLALEGVEPGMKLGILGGWPALEELVVAAYKEAVDPDLFRAMFNDIGDVLTSLCDERMALREQADHAEALAKGLVAAVESHGLDIPIGVPLEQSSQFPNWTEIPQPTGNMRLFNRVGRGHLVRWNKSSMSCHKEAGGFFRRLCDRIHLYARDKLELVDVTKEDSLCQNCVKQSDRACGVAT